MAIQSAVQVDSGAQGCLRGNKKAQGRPGHILSGDINRYEGRSHSCMDLLEIFGVKESYQLPDTIMAALLSEKATEYVDAVRDSGISDLRDYYLI